MSLPLKFVDMTNSPAPFRVDLQGVSVSQIGWLVFLNESPYTLYTSLGGLQIGPIPAWDEYPVQVARKIGPVWHTLSGATEPLIVNPVYFVSPGLTYPSYILQISVYLQGEEPPNTSPRSLQRQSYIPNNITTNMSGTNSLSNEGLAAGTQVVDMGDSTQSLLVLMFNDGHGNWYVDQAGVVHHAIKINSTGTPLQVGQLGDLTEVLGGLTIDQALTVVGAANLLSASLSSTLSVTGATTLSTVSTSGLATLDSEAVTNNATIGGTLGVTGNTSLSTMSTSGAATLNSAVVTNNATVGGTLGVTGNTSLSTMNASGNIQIQGIVWNRNTSDKLSQTHAFTGTGSGTYNHGCASAPFMVIPIVNTTGSATQGFDSVTATQVHITLGASLSFKAMCFL